MKYNGKTRVLIGEEEFAKLVGGIIAKELRASLTAHLAGHTNLAFVVAFGELFNRVSTFRTSRTAGRTSRIDPVRHVDAISTSPMSDEKIGHVFFTRGVGLEVREHVLVTDGIRPFRAHATKMHAADLFIADATQSVTASMIFISTV
jgi:hypothetical protein